MGKNYRRKSVSRPRRSTSRFLCFLISFLGGYLTATVFDLTSVMHWISQYGFDNKRNLTANDIQVSQTVKKPKFEFYTLLAKDNRGVIAVESAPKNLSSPAQLMMPIAEKDHPKTAPPLTELEVTPANVTERFSQTKERIKEVTKVPGNRSSESTPSVNPLSTKIISGIPSAHANRVKKGPLPRVAPLPSPVISVTSKPAIHPEPVSEKEAYLVQLGAFKSQADADRFKALLSLKGFTSAVMRSEQQHMSWFKVVMGPFRSRMDAEKMLVTLARSEHIRGMVRKMEA